MASEASDRIHDLLEYGVPFDRDLAGHLVLSREAAHSARRIVRVNGDWPALPSWRRWSRPCARTPSIRIIEGFIAESLRVSAGRVAGIVARPRQGGKRRGVHSRPTPSFSPTGGIGHLYAVTTNPPEAEGAGVGMAARAGAVVADPEFVQFHPTALAVGRDPAPLATEALRGEGAKLINAAGERFMLKIHPLAELAPRDIVARAIHNEVVAGRGAFLDCREAIGERFPKDFPTVYAYCREAGIDPVTQPIPIAPAEHYLMGGLLVDANGRTTLDGLWACGETASTGAHGANRLASNSLLEAVVFAARVAEDVSEHTRPPRLLTASERPDGGAFESAPSPEELALLRDTMSAHVGVVRDRAGLEKALAVIAMLEERSRSPRFLNMLTTAKLIAAAALQRTESRGGHYRSDFPDPDPAWRHRTFMTLADAERDRQPTSAIGTERGGGAARCTMRATRRR